MVQFQEISLIEAINPRVLSVHIGPKGLVRYIVVHCASVKGEASQEYVWGAVMW